MCGVCSSPRRAPSRACLSARGCGAAISCCGSITSVAAFGTRRRIPGFLSAGVVDAFGSRGAGGRRDSETGCPSCGSKCTAASRAASPTECFGRSGRGRRFRYNDANFAWRRSFAGYKRDGIARGGGAVARPPHRSVGGIAGLAEIAAAERPPRARGFASCEWTL